MSFVSNGIGENFYSPTLPTYVWRDCFELLSLDYKQKVHTYAVNNDDRDLVKFMQDAIYAQTLHIEHILKVKYGWFLDAQNDYVADLVFCYRLFCPPTEFLTIFETRYPNVEDGKETLWHFIEGLEPADLDDENFRFKLEFMVALVQTNAVQVKMSRDLKRLTRTMASSSSSEALSSFLSSPQMSSPGSWRLTSSGSYSSGTLRSPSPGRPRRISSCAPSPPPLIGLLEPVAENPETPSATLTQITTKETWPGVSAQALGITQRECDVFRRVRTGEVLTGEGTNIDELMELLSWTTRWVSTKILSFDSFEKRADAISGFIALASEFRKMDNFNGIMEIIQSLRSGPIERLKESWMLVPPHLMSDWNSIVELMSSANNYHNYRNVLKAIDFNSPCLPCVMVLLQDIAAIDLPDWTDGKINMEYVSRVSMVLRVFRTFQKNCHNITTGIPELYADLVLTDDDIEKLSLTTCNTDNAPSRSRAGSLTLRTLRRKKINLQQSIFSRPVATEFGQEDWDRIMAVGEVMTFEAGETILDLDLELQPYKTLNFYYIEEGTVQACRNHGRWYEVSEGNGVGLLAFLNVQTSLSIVATSHVVLKMAHVPYVLQLVETDLELATRFYKYIAARINTALRVTMAQLSNEDAPIPRSESIEKVDKPLEPPIKNSPRFLSPQPSPVTSPRAPSPTPSPRTPSPNLRASPSMKNATIMEYPLSEYFGLQDDESILKSYEGRYRRVTGRIFVTKYNLFFYGKSFGVQTKKQVRFSQVVYVKALTKQLEVKLDTKVLKFMFKTQDDVNEAEALIGSVFNKGLSSSTGGSRKPSKTISKSALDTVMSPADWQLILSGTTNASYSAGSEIISEGVQHTRLCQIVKGKCVITKKIIKNNIETTEQIASRHPGDFFGEMSFLEPGSLASASVVADTDVEICILDFQYITVLLSVYRHLGPSLYKYLALLLQNRLFELEQK